MEKMMKEQLNMDKTNDQMLKCLKEENKILHEIINQMNITINRMVDAFIVEKNIF